MVRDDVFDLLELHPEATDLDLIVHAPQVVQFTVPPDSAITGPVHRLTAVGAGEEHQLVEVRAVEVTGGHPAAPDPDVAGEAFRDHA